MSLAKRRIGRRLTELELWPPKWVPWVLGGGALVVLLLVLGIAVARFLASEEQLHEDVEFLRCMTKVMRALGVRQELVAKGVQVLPTLSTC